MKFSRLRNAPTIPSGVQQHITIAHDLQLLADFVVDMAVAGMQLFQLAGMDVNVPVGEFVCRDAFHRVPVWENSLDDMEVVPTVPSSQSAGGRKWGC